MALCLTLAVTIAGVGLAVPPPARADGLARETVVVATSTGEHRFDVEIAERDETRMRGLMFRQSLAPRAGMLFLYSGEQPVSMWMRNTYISLDMIFIKGDGTVHRIEENTEPFSERIVDSGDPVLAVLEIKAGVAAEIGLKPGDRVRHRRFKAAAKQ